MELKRIHTISFVLVVAVVCVGVIGFGYYGEMTTTHFKELETDVEIMMDLHERHGQHFGTSTDLLELIIQESHDERQLETELMILEGFEPNQEMLISMLTGKDSGLLA